MTAGELIKALSALDPATPVATAFEDVPEHAQGLDRGELETRTGDKGPGKVYVLFFSQQSDVYADEAAIDISMNQGEAK